MVIAVDSDGKAVSSPSLWPGRLIHRTSSVMIIMTQIFTCFYCLDSTIDFDTQRIPLPYNYTSVRRVPIVQIGYNKLNKNNNAFFSGDRKGVVEVNRQKFLKEWSEVKDDLNTKFIAVILTNKDWGWLSSYAAGRTLDIDRCCVKQGDELLQQFLDDDRTLMVVVNQHSNLAHPKILTIPAGVPTKWEHNEVQLFDSIREVQKVGERSDYSFLLHYAHLTCMTYFYTNI